MNGGVSKQREEKAMADLSAVADAVFEVPALSEVKAALMGLRRKMDEFGA